MKVLVLGGSSSKKSINKRLAYYAADLLKQKNPQAELIKLDLNDFDLPLFGVDLEEKIGQPEPAKKFLKHIQDCDLFILSLAEHNGSYSAAFKNLMDWTSRIDGKMFLQKPMLLMATSPGPRGGASVLEAAQKRFPFMGGNIKVTFSLPEFEKNFSDEKGITLAEKKSELEKALQAFQS